MAKLEAFLFMAIKAMFDDLDVFCRASLRTSRDAFLLREPLPELELMAGGLVAMVEELDDEQDGLLLMPIEAAICLGGSMMFLPKESIQEAMAQQELDEEGLLTVHEVGNLLVGTFGRMAREQANYLHAIRLKDVIIKPGMNIHHIPFVGQSPVCYRFILKTDRSDPFTCSLYLPDKVLKKMFPDEPCWGTVEVSPAAVAAADPGAPASGWNGPLGWHGGPSPVWGGAAPGIGGPPFGGPGAPPGAVPPGWNGASAPGWSGPPHGWGGSPPHGVPGVPGPPHGGYVGSHPGGGELRGLRSDYPGGGGGADVLPNRRALAHLLTGHSDSALPTRAFVGTHVLVVDDSWVARRALAQMLIPHGCVVHDARDAVAAAQVLGERRVDLILLDLLLPGESGLSFCSRLRFEGMTEQTPVVIISGVSTPDNVVQAIRAGASFFLVKPVDEEYLLRILHGVLRQYRSAPQRVGMAG